MQHILSDTGRLSFEYGGLSVQDAGPAVVLVVGEDEQQLRLAPASQPSRRSWAQQTPLGEVRGSSFRWRMEPGVVLTWSVGAFSQRPGLLLIATFCNETQAPLRLRNVALLEAADPGYTVSGDPSSWWLMSPAGGPAGNLGQLLPSENDRIVAVWKGFNRPVPHELSRDEKANDGHWRQFRDFVTLYREGCENGVACAAVGTEADVDFDWYVEGNTGRLQIISRMSGVVVDPGECRRSEAVAILGGPYQDAVDSLFRWIVATHGSRTHRGPIVGWCSWYDRGPRISADHTIAVAGAAAQLRERIPMDVIQIDDGYQRQVGDWECNDSFPEGWQPVLEAIRDAKATPGIWLAPLVVHAKAGGANYTCTDGTILEVHPDWFQRTARGELAQQGDNWGPVSHWIDPSHPQVQLFLRRIIRRMRQEGFRYFKIDFNTISDNARLYDSKKTRLQVYRDLYKLYRQEMGEDAYLLSCSGFTRGTIGFADASRIGPDSAPQWLAPHPCCIRDAIWAVGETASANGVFYANDPDVTYTLPRSRLSQEELRTWHSFVGLLGGLAMVSEPLNRAEYQAEEALRMLEILTPPAPEKGRSLHPGTDRHHRSFGFIAQRPWEAFASVLLYNPDEQPADQTLGIPQPSAIGDRFHLWSFWDREYLGTVDSSIAIRDLAPHASKLLRVSAVSDDARIPVLVGSDLHISMGAAEIRDLRRTATAVEILLTDAGARSGSLWLYGEASLYLQAFEAMESAALLDRGGGLWELAILNRVRGARQRVRLEL